MTGSQSSLCVLLLDSDSDFLETLANFGKKEKICCETFLLTKDSRPKLENFLQDNAPEVVVLDLDIDDKLQFGQIISEIFRVPLNSRPLILGYSKHEETNLMQVAYSRGLDDYMKKPFTPIELWLRVGFLLKIKRLQQQLDQANRKLSFLNMELSQANLKLKELTVTDELTGLNNMRFMADYLAKHFNLLVRHPRPFSVLMLDLDHFKEVNDRNDHLVGSRTIQMVGQIIDDCMRTSDIKARYGGDEYIIAMPETDAEGARGAAERLVTAIRNGTFHGNHGEFKITASVGFSTFVHGTHNKYTDLLREADLALYSAKSTGRDRWVEYIDGLAKNDYSEEQSSLLSEIRKVTS